MPLLTTWAKTCSGCSMHQISNCSVTTSSMLGKKQQLRDKQVLRGMMLRHQLEMGGLRDMHVCVRVCMHIAVWVSLALCRGALERKLQSLLRRAAAGVRPPSRETARVEVAVARAAEAVARAAAGRPRSRKRTFLPRLRPISRLRGTQTVLRAVPVVPVKFQQALVCDMTFIRRSQWWLFAFDSCTCYCLLLCNYCVDLIVCKHLQYQLGQPWRLRMIHLSSTTTMPGKGCLPECLPTQH